jgi:hypothetical protein
MEKKKVVSKATGNIVSAKGGVRKGAGRPKGGTNQVSVHGLLEALEKKTNGVNYETVLMEDFINARNSKDHQLVVKYHNLILNKLMTHVSKIEITDSQDTIEMKQKAFTDALAKLAGIKKE